MFLNRVTSRCRPSILISCVLTIIFLLFQLLFQLWLEWMEGTLMLVQHVETRIDSLEDVKEPVLVWWTPFTGNRGSYLECKNVKCFITEDRLFHFHPNFQMYLFYGSNIKISDLPLPRKRHNIWSLLHEESPRNVPFLSHHDGLSLFNYSSTFSRFSDIPLTFQYLKDIESITGNTYFVPLKTKNELLKNLAPVLYIQSDCDTPIDRDSYIQKLMKFLSIDSYGACLHNKELPASLTDPMESIAKEEFLHFVARYKFTIAFENAVCEDYITEKLWRPLIVGSVPVYLGSPSVTDWLPNKNSAILAEDFSSPEDLAAYILEINANDEKYSLYLSHKEGILTNDNLTTALRFREWSLPESDGYHFIDHFECQMCLHAHQHATSSIRMKVASEKDYFCLKPKSSLSKQANHSNPWLHLWEYSKCEAFVLNEFVSKGFRYINATYFNNQVWSRLKTKQCGDSF